MENADLMYLILFNFFINLFLLPNQKIQKNPSYKFLIYKYYILEEQ